MKIFSFFLLVLFLFSCKKNEEIKVANDGLPKPYIMVLGVAQDGGYPQIGCDKDCCSKQNIKSNGQKYVSSLALVDPNSKKYWLFDATPDLNEQLSHLRNTLDDDYNFLPSGIFLTHAHIGHYTGLVYLGREVMNSQNVPVYAMPRMVNFINAYGPWNQLTTLNNINLRSIFRDFPVSVNKRIKVIPIPAPHREEYSEMVAYRIETPNKSTLYIPDIDKWENWHIDLKLLVEDLDFVFVDGTFYDENELPGRDISEIPHPPIVKTMDYLDDLSDENKAKIHFIHFNHSNPAFKKGSKEMEMILDRGFKIAKQFKVY